MPLNLLTARAVQSKSKRGRYADGGGLVLQISKWGTKSWIFRYERKGREHHMGLGSLQLVPLASARELARECRELLGKKRDPIEARKAGDEAARVAVARDICFEDCAGQYIEAQCAGWKNAKHRAQWSSTLSAYAYPLIGQLSVASIDTALVVKCLEPIWTSKPETGKRVRGRIESILGWAGVRGYRSGNNPAQWRGHLDKLLPAPGKVRAVRHHPAMPYVDVAQFMGELRRREEIGARALELTVLTGLRTGEVIGARWSEFDLAAKIGTIPAVRMKARRDHRVPLSARALEILKHLPGDRDDESPLFRGAGAQETLSNMAMLQLLDRMGRSEFTVHGFRSSFRDWAAETTAHPSDVVEMALAHVVGDKVEAAYRRGDLFEKRRRLMDDWARYCGRPAAGGANVVPLRGRRQAGARR